MSEHHCHPLPLAPPHPAPAILHELRMLAAIPLRGYLKTYHRLHIEGRQNLPQNRSFILIANHTSHLDALCLLSALPLLQLRRAFPAAAQDYFRKGIQRFGLALFANSIPFSRHAHTRQTLARCRQLLAAPNSILILFPEGTRSPTGELAEFRPGIGSLLAGTDIPVLPCALQGTHAAMPKGALIPRPRPLRLTIGQPRHYRTLSHGRDAHHWIAHDLQQAVQHLLCT